MKVKNQDLRLVLTAILIGITSGCVVVLYRYLLGKIESIIAYLSDIIHKEPMIFLTYAISALVVAALISYLLKKEALIGGSGIPQVEAELYGLIKPRHARVLLYKFLGGISSAFCGFSLGREGPSIQLGAMMAKVIGEKIGIKDGDLLLATGAAAGLSGAFSAPLSGILFVLEELYRSFSGKVMIVSMVAVTISDFIASYIFGFTPTFSFLIRDAIPLESYHLVVIIGVITGLFGSLYNKSMIGFQKVFAKLSLNLRILITLVVSLFMMWSFPIVLGGGHYILNAIDILTPVYFLIVLLIVKFIFSLISFTSGAPGGIFFPLLIKGALIGAIFASIACDLGLMSDAYFYHFVALGMTGLFIAIVRAPITGIILVFEMTGSISNLLAFVVSGAIAYFVAESLKVEPIYESLLAKYAPIKQGKEYRLKILTMIVGHGSQLEDKMIKDIAWPSGARVIEVIRQHREYVAEGDFRLKIGDEVKISIDTGDLSSAHKELKKLFQSE